MINDQTTLATAPVDRSRGRGFLVRVHWPLVIPRPNLLTLLFLLLLFAIYARPFADLDFAWQVRTGGEVVQGGKFRVEDSFTYTIAGKQLPDFEWLYEVFLWTVWSVAGYGGLHLLKTLCVLTPLFLVGRRLRLEGAGWHAVLASLVVAILVLIPTWNLRPFSCTTIGLLLLSGWLHDHCSGRRALSWEVPLLMLVWANAHPGVITGQGLLAGAIAWEWLNRWLCLNSPLNRAACWRLTFVGGLGLLASLVCPGPFERLRYTFNPDLAHPIMRGFVEMQPLYCFALAPPYLASLAFVVAAVVFLTLVQRFRVHRLWEVALLAGLALLANFALRSLQDWLLVMLAVGVPHVVALYRDGVHTMFKARRRSGMFHGLFLAERTAKRVLTAPPFRFQRSWAVLLLLLLSIFSLAPALAGLVPRHHGVDWPAGVVDHIEEHDLRGRFFCNANHGAYLVWRRGPEKAHCYVDTRGFFFPPYLLEDALFVPQLGDDWQQRLRRVLDSGTDYFLLETKGEPGALWRALEGHVEPLYHDGDTVLLRAAQVRAWLETEKKGH
jgi:hypothetical protein